MATDRVNLLPKSSRSGGAAQLQSYLIWSWVSALIALGMMSMSKIREEGAKVDRYQRMVASAKAMGASVQEITNKAKDAEEANRKFSDTKEFLEKRVTWTEALKELSLLIPDSVWLSTLSSKRDEPNRAPFLELVGEAPSQGKIVNFLESLEMSFYFRDVLMKKSEKVPDVQPDLYRFTFEVDVPQLADRGKKDVKKGK